MPVRRGALVTGASRGIGAACAQALARDGHDLALAARDVPSLQSVAERCEELGARAVVIPTDVTDEDQVRSMVDKAAAELGGLHVLVNNAGGSPFMAPITDTRASGWDKLLRLNLTHIFWSLQQAARVMLDQGDGSIVNIASYAGMGAAPTLAAYGAAKAGLISLTQTAAAEWGTAGIRVNAVAPGWIRTDMNRTVWENDEAARAFVAGTALQRWGEAEEVAEAVAFLASAASSYITGHTLLVDGGLSN
jgi:NAD(P)-dependent dehydrogenase (short-subunit alcohol dehydrogenase family)